MTQRPVPDVGGLLAGFMAQVPEAARPRFLALLERGAAARYRYWAEQLPAHAAGLRACAAREEEIATRSEAVVPIDAGAREKLESLIPAARDAYYAIFDGVPILEQLRIQAGAERLGAGAWRGMAQAMSDAHAREVLDGCAVLEEVSASYLDTLVAG
jgi:hypothetical protein